MTIPAGTLVPRDARDFGSYQLIAKLATGGMAEIFLARPSDHHNDVIVLKRILPHLAEDEHFVTMFRDEADLASRLVHKNVCQVHAFGEFAGTWFIAMEYLHGVPLSRMMTRLSKAQKMLDVRVVAGIIVQACEGLHSAHEARTATGEMLSVVHRDVSPPNIMVCADGTVKLLDFGIAKARGANSRTRTGTVKGKNAYMSPEQILGKPLDRRSDIFALAVVMYEMLAIRRLFHRESDFLTFKAITEEPIPDIRERRPDLPAGMQAALTQAMARDPNGRFETAQNFAAAIRSSVSAIGGIASPADLARLLATDFGDEMAARDEILKAADDPSPGVAVPPVTPPPPRPTPPPIPPLIPPMAASRHGELGQQRARAPTGPHDSVPSMIVHNTPTGRITPMARPDTAGFNATSELDVVVDADSSVPDLSASVPADTWMADPDTNLLRSHRMKSVRNAMIAVAMLAAVGVALIVLFTRGGEDPAPVVRVSVDAAVKAAVPPATIDAGSDSHQAIVSLSKYGFYSIDASVKSTIFIDGRNMGETPMLSMPLPPGPHKVHAVGPKGKTKDFAITIYGGQPTNEAPITW